MRKELITRLPASIERVLLALAVIASMLYRTEGLQRQSRALGTLAALQLVTGLSNVVLDWPLVAALAHTGGAAALLGVLVWCLTASQPRRTGVPAVRVNTTTTRASA